MLATGLVVLIQKLAKLSFSKRHLTRSAPFAEKINDNCCHHINIQNAAGECTDDLERNGECPIPRLYDRQQRSHNPPLKPAQRKRQRQKHNLAQTDVIPPLIQEAKPSQYSQRKSNPSLGADSTRRSQSVRVFKVLRSLADRARLRSSLETPVRISVAPPRKQSEGDTLSLRKPPSQPVASSESPLPQ